MSAPTQEELHALARIVGEETWNDECDVWTCVGEGAPGYWSAWTLEESADGIPGWHVDATPHTYSVRREIGWYVQEGDVEPRDLEALVRLCAAMDAAHAELERVLGEVSG